MKHPLRIFLLMSFLCCAFCNNAEAQFFRKLFGGRNRDRERYESRTTTKSPSQNKSSAKTKSLTPVKKKQEFTYPPGITKSRYRIDVFAHLYLDELIKDNKATFKGKIPDKATAGLDFYEGVKLAADTLNDLGYQLELYVHDASMISESPSALIGSKSLDSSDLIIGAVNNQYIPALAGYCKKQKINFVSTLSPSDAGIKDNPYFIMLQPSLQTHCEWIKDEINKKYKNVTPIVLYRNSVTVDSNANNYLKIADGTAIKIKCDNIPDKEKLQGLISKTGTNVILMPIMDVDYAEKILLQLYAFFPQSNFEVFGMPSWRSMNALKKPDAFPNLGVNISIPFYYDISTGIGQAIANNYKKDTNGNKPVDMVFRGYETMLWFTYLLNKYGTIFNDKIGDNSAANFTRYDVKLKRDKEDRIMYMENKHINLIRYQSSSYVVEQ